MKTLQKVEVVQMKKVARSISKQKRSYAFESLENRRVLAADLGWDGPGQGSADLTYFIENAPAGLSMDEVRSAIETALDAWSKVVDVDFTEASQAGLRNSIDFSFESIDGASGVLAQAFFPNSSPWATSKAGDVTFDVSESWELGNSLGNQATDLVAVAVHEIGHALGLDHSALASSIMYATISPSESFSELSDSDIAQIQLIYAARDNTGDNQDTGNSDDGGTGTGVDNDTDTDAGDNTDTSGGGSGTDGTTNPPPNNSTPWINHQSQGVLVTINDTVIDAFFSRYDTNDDLSLAADELPARLQLKLDQLGFDVDADGSISKEEFGTGIRNLQKSYFEKLDANADGLLGEDEIASRVWEQLSRSDADADGSISLDEFVDFQSKTAFQRLDVNEDGQVTADEVSEKQWNKLTRFDADENGTISSEEYTAFTQRNVWGHRHGPWGRTPAFGGQVNISFGNGRVTIQVSTPFARRW